MEEEVEANKPQKPVRRILREMYRIPESYRPPPIADLPNDTQYPNLNATEYRYQIIDYELPVLHDFMEFLDVNAFDLVAVATNDYVGRVWCGSIFAYRSFDEFAESGRELFRLRVDASITSMRFYYDDMILLTSAAGDIQLWSTQSPMRNPDGYSLYNITRKSEHIGMVTALELLGTKRERAITGTSSDNCIKIWNITSCDIVSDYTYRDAHTRSVAGLSAKPDDGYLFASCSRDGSLLVWDYRKLRPVIKHLNGGPAFTVVNWTNRNGIDQILTGDMEGKLEIRDPRNFKETLECKQICDRPIHRFKPSGDLLGVISQNTHLDVFDATQNYSSVYRSADADDFVRDLHWTDARAFNSIGWDTKLTKHSF